MRALFVVQRYGEEVAGGAEHACREFATRLARRGHQVDALSSCASSYVDWSNVYAAGDSQLDGVLLHRLPVVEPRDDRLFRALHARAVYGRKPVPLHLQRAWMHAQGPLIPSLGPWLRQRAGAYDVIVFFTYLYYTTWAGLGPASAGAPTVLHPTAHDEPALYLTLFDGMFRLPAAFAFLTEEEMGLVSRRFGIHPPCGLFGIGVDLDSAGDGAAFRLAHGLGDRPYVLFLGRVDPEKGSDELFDFFVAYKRRNPGPLALVVLGQHVTPLPFHPDVVPIDGRAEESVKLAALDGATALVQPSYFESFSIVLVEAWAQRRPALVQGRCDVLAAQARRSGGALAYRGFAEFEAALQLVTSEPQTASALGDAGRRFVEDHYTWDPIIDRYEGFLDRRAGWRSP